MSVRLDKGPGSIDLVWALVSGTVAQLLMSLTDMPEQAPSDDFLLLNRIARVDGEGDKWLLWGSNGFDLSGPYDAKVRTGYLVDVPPPKPVAVPEAEAYDFDGPPMLAFANSLADGSSLDLKASPRALPSDQGQDVGMLAGALAGPGLTVRNPAATTFRVTMLGTSGRRAEGDWDFGGVTAEGQKVEGYYNAFRKKGAFRYVA